MNNYIIVRRNHWTSEADLEAAAARSTKVGEDMADRVSWIRTYVLVEPSGKLGTVCVYQAISEEALREHAHCAELPVDEILPCGGTLVIRPDPS